MNINSGIKQAVILTIGIIVLGFCIKSGLESVISNDRKVVVKGLAEKEVEADKVTWPIVSKEIGNDLPELYQKINATTRTIRNFLVENGVKANEINVNAPVVIDLNAERYGENLDFPVILHLHPVLCVPPFSNLRHHNNPMQKEVCSKRSIF